MNRRQWTWVVIALVAAAILAPHAVGVVLKTRHEYPWDGKVDWFAAKGWWSGVDPYSKEQLRIIRLDGLGHPPTTPFWFLPFASLDLFGMNFAIACIVVCLLVGHFLLITTAFAWPRPWPARVAVVLLGTVVVLCAPWMTYHLNLAQLSELIAFFITLGWFFVRRGRDVPAGIALGLACTFKFFPGLLVACLLLARRVRLAVAAFATWLVVNAIMLSRFGLKSWPEFFAGNRILTEYWIGNMRNASIFGIVLRAFVPSCKGPSRSIPAATEIAIAIAVCTIALLWWLSRRFWRDNATIDVPYSLFAVAGYFFNPWVWEHYNALLILPLAVAVVVLLRGRLAPGQPPLSRRLRLFGAGIVATVVGILLFLPLGYCAGFGGRIRRPAMHFAMHLAEVTNWISPVLMMLLFAAILWASRPRATTSAPT